MSDRRNIQGSLIDLYKDSIGLIVKAQLGVPDLITRVMMLCGGQEKQLAAELYKIWISHNPDAPLLHAVYFNYAMALVDNGDRFGAINAMRECIRINPDFNSAYVNLGRLLEDTGQTGPAVSKWFDLVNRLPTVNGEAIAIKTTALNQIGRVLRSNNENGLAEDCLKKSLDLNATQTEVIQHWIAVRQAQCKRPTIVGWDRVTVKDLLTQVFPWSLANYSDDPMFQLATSFVHNKRSIGVTPRITPPHDPKLRAGSRKLRLGYVSSDFREHAVGFGMTEVLELHDRNRFEIYGYYCGISRVDDTQLRIKDAVDHWTDINGMSDEDAARKIAEDGIDILVDLNGYTMNARTKVFALRPAPVNVNWFGFPSTMGSPYHHYIIADQTIIPAESEMYYSEKVLRLPCYQPNDRKRVVAERRPLRHEANLPDDAFVFCCLNGLQKLTAITFQRWLTILKGVPNSVLWLLGADKETNERLGAHAAQDGVAPERLIFAERANNADHLARYPLADLFLDNLPYGAHTTAADSLWMGVPILTLVGRAFHTRVCASVVTAAGIGEMVCTTADDYVTRAIELGNDRVKMAAIKEKLVSGRDSCLLFDTTHLVASLEGLYETMWKDFEAGALPVPDLANLDIYHEIGTELDHERVETLSGDEYRLLYDTKLKTWNETYPVNPDARLWRKAS